MTRRERRIRHGRTRRIVVGLMALGTIGLSVGVAAPAGAQNYRVDNGSPGAGNYPKYDYNCTGDGQANNGNAQDRGHSYIACD
jgi:hypothetical protein